VYARHSGRMAEREYVRNRGGVMMHRCVSRISNVRDAPWDLKVWYCPRVASEAESCDWCADTLRERLCVCSRGSATDAPTDGQMVVEAPRYC
jgi:hypothetical protein